MSYAPWKQKVLDDLVFDEASHRYTLKGKRVPGVTSIISAEGDSFARVPKQALEQARQRGNIVHSITEKFDLGTLTDIERADLALVGYDGYLSAWEEFCTDYRAVPVLIEQFVYHSGLRYAGTLDRLMDLNNLGPSVVDIKTGEYVDKYRLQTAGYLAALNDGRESGLIKGRAVVCLQPNGRYKVFPHLYDTIDSDMSAFHGLLKYYEWKESQK